MRITMIGAGYVGLVSGACFADFGHEVVCVDRDPAKLELLELGRMPIYEPGLDELVARNAVQKRLRFSSDLAASVAASDVVFIAVGTPSRRGDGHADLSYVYGAAAEIGRALDGFTIVVTKSTVPVGTGDEVERIIREANPDADFAVVSNPEFLREGSAIEDFKRPDRVLIGTEDETVIRPAVARLRAAGIDAVGPLPADTMFHPPARARYDVAICMYHDQALIPAKTLAFDQTVNATLGLPIIRTSPDHGTAADIAGSGDARPDSFLAAIRLAGRMAEVGKGASSSAATANA